MNEPLGDLFTGHERREMLRRFVSIHNDPQSSVELRYRLACHCRFWLHQATGIEPLVNYGTLLGAIRDRDLIPWDRDVDLVLHPQARAQVAEALRRRDYGGLDLIRVEEYLISFTAPYAPGEYVDVHPYYAFPAAPDVYQLLVTRNATCDVMRADMDSPATCTIRGETWACPARPEHYLELSYGAGWRDPVVWKREPLAWDVDKLYR